MLTESQANKKGIAHFEGDLRKIAPKKLADNCCTLWQKDLGRPFDILNAFIIISTEYNLSIKDQKKTYAFIPI